MQITFPQGEDADAQWRKDIERRILGLEMSHSLEHAAAYDDAGNVQIRIGDLDGEGDYGVEIGGGRVRAMDIASGSTSDNSPTITATHTAILSPTITPPAWATETLINATAIVVMDVANGYVELNTSIASGPITTVRGEGGSTATGVSSLSYSVMGNASFDVELMASRGLTGVTDGYTASLAWTSIFLR